MTNEETLQVLRRVYPEISLKAYEGVLEVLDVIPSNDKSFYPIPTRMNDNVILIFPGYKIVVEPDGKTAVSIPFSTNRDRMMELIKLIGQYSQSVQGSQLK